MRKCIVLLAVILLSSGCASLALQSGPGKEFQDAAASLQDKKYSAALASYRNILRDAPDTAYAVDARFEIALMYATPDNPQKDYVQAIQSFEEFIRLYPDNRRTPDARVWIAVLKNILDLKKDNESLKKNIEELKQLDIRHEERRRK